MGYTYPVQITQWTFASTPQHPVLLSFVQHLTEYLSKVKAAALAGSHEREADPLLRTGPVAVTQATSSWLERTVPGFRWNSVTGLKDGGKSKLVRDVLILPVTAFRYGSLLFPKASCAEASADDSFRTALGVAGTVIWAQSPSQIRTRGYSIMGWAHGSISIFLSRQESCVVAFSAVAVTGPKCRARRSTGQRQRVSMEREEWPKRPAIKATVIVTVTFPHARAAPRATPR